MLNKIWTYLQYGNRFCGIEHTINSNTPISVSILKQSKKELNLESTFQIDSIENIPKKLSKNQHAILVVNNGNVLSKTIESNQKEPLKLVYKAFPNINIEEFYFEIISESRSYFISICRKNYVDALISNYSENKIHIISFSLGNSSISGIKTFIDKKEVQTSNSIVTIENQEITGINKVNVENEIYDINGLNVSNQELLSLSGALQTVLRNNITITNYEDKKNHLLTEFKHIQFFNQFLKSAGLLILGILLINFFVFNHYFNQVNNLKQVSEINESTKQKIVTLNSLVSKKQKMVDDLLKSNGSKTSYFANSIMQSLPETLLLSEFNFQPLKKRIKEDKPIELDDLKIILSGSSTDSSLFSKWISQLEQMDWVKHVDIIDYGSSSSSVSDFEIKIILSDE
ncbi:hypothetical protein [Psychroserpens luteus]|uniref:Fimbrial assembly protein (PilN) n=1 Tax=Psychroserpens luteus TaxID=1434066 RepID=A0ABW5ZV18_9FLAO|nr:hypothetical protein [Psychroserpens luteus]